MKKRYFIYEIIATGNLSTTRELSLIKPQPDDGFDTYEEGESHIENLFTQGTEYGFLKADNRTWYKYTILPIFSKK